jgi:hypothetical protein
MMILSLSGIGSSFAQRESKSLTDNLTISQFKSLYINSVRNRYTFLYKTARIGKVTVTFLGHKIKIAGDDPAVGLYFVPVNDPSKTMKATRIAENSPSKIIGVAPGTGSSPVRIEVRTQFSGSGGTLLKAVRVITSGFTLEES